MSVCGGWLEKQARPVRSLMLMACGGNGIAPSHRHATPPPQLLAPLLSSRSRWTFSSGTPHPPHCTTSTFAPEDSREASAPRWGAKQGRVAGGECCCKGACGRQLGSHPGCTPLASSCTNLAKWTAFPAPAELAQQRCVAPEPAGCQQGLLEAHCGPPPAPQQR